MQTAKEKLEVLKEFLEGKTIFYKDETARLNDSEEVWMTDADPLGCSELFVDFIRDYFLIKDWRVVKEKKTVTLYRYTIRELMSGKISQGSWVSSLYKNYADYVLLKTETKEIEVEG